MGFISKKKYLLLTIVIIIAFFIFRLPQIHLPFIWDEAWVYGPAVRLMAQTGLSFLPDSLPVGLYRGHPLLFHFLNASWLKIFGNTLESVHLFNLLVSCALIFAVFMFCKKYYSEKAGVAASFALCLQPVFIAQSTLALPEVMLALFCLLALYAFLQNNYAWYFVFACAATLTKETGIAIILACGLIYFIREIRQVTGKFPLFLFGLVKITLPVIPLIAFLIIQYKMHGWFLFPEHIGYVSYDPATIGNKLVKEYLTFAFFVQGRNLLFFALLISMGWMFYKKQKFQDNRIKLSLMLFILVYALIGAFNFYTKRYTLCIIPVFIVISLGMTFQAFKNKYLLPVFMVVYFLTQLSNIRHKTTSDHNLGFVDVIRANQSMTDYCLQQNLKDQKITGFFISRTIMTTPLSGYVNDNEVFTQMYGDYRESDYYIVSNFDTNEMFLNFRESPDLVMIKRFEHGPAWIELYKRKVNKTIL